MAPVALAMKSIAPLALPMVAPAASVAAVTLPSLTGGMYASAGPIGCEPPTLTAMSRACWLVATQLRKNAAQSAFLALLLMPYVSGADIAACLPPADAEGIRKNPALPAICLSRLPDSQSPSNMNRFLPAMKRLIMVA